MPQTKTNIKRLVRNHYIRYRYYSNDADYLREFKRPLKKDKIAKEDNGEKWFISKLD